MDRQQVRVIVYAWGKPYVDRLLNYAVASLLAPGNLLALVEFFDCTLVIVTNEHLFKYVDSHPSMKRVKSLCPVRLVPLDDLIGEPWQYGISLAYALFRGFSDLGDAMTKTYLLFLNADFVLADGCYERLIPHLKRGEPVLLAPSYCVIEEEVEPLLEKIRNPDDGALVISPRQMAGMIIDHRHNTIRAKTISQRSVHFEYMDQAYWQVDESTMIGRQMPISMVAMRPERVLSVINTFWDWGITYEFCPSRKLTVLGDSDEFLILELRSENTHLDLIRLGPATPKDAAARMSGYLTRYQLDNARFPLTLHAKSVPSYISGPQSELGGFLDEVLKIYQTGPLLNHSNHPQWLYHKAHLTRNIELRKLQKQLSRLHCGYNKERSRIFRMQESMGLLSCVGLVLPDFVQRPRLNLSFLEEFAPKDIVFRKAGVGVSSVVDRNFAEALQELSSRHEAAISVLKTRLAALEETVLPTMDTFFQHVALVDADQASGKGSGRGGVRHLAQRVAAHLFGSIPRTRSLHPLQFIYKDISAQLDQARDAEWGILFVGEKDGLGSRVGPRQTARCFRISAAALLQSDVESAVDEAWCGLSVVELGRDDFQDLLGLQRALLPHMLPGGHIVMFWINHGCESSEALRQALIQAAGIESEGASVQFFTLTQDWGGLDLVKALRESSSMSRSSRGFALLAALQNFSRHHLLRKRPKIGAADSGNCLGMIIKFEVARRPPEASDHAPPASSAQITLAVSR
ncbi:MAG TPA: hypothetical protein VGJ20_19585 [Xanthobacteraceae bacterium]